MNTPNPLLPQGSLPQRGKSSVYVKILVIVGIHTVLIGGILMVGCKDAAKDHASTTPAEETVAASSNSSPMSTDLTAPPATTPAPAPMPTPSVAGTATMPVAPVTPAPAPIISPVTSMPVPATPGVAKEYVIVSGDLLSTIAKRNGVSLKALQDANPGLDPKKLKIGYKLQIPAGAATSPIVASPSATTEKADATATATGDSTVYTVKSGDVLMRIARSHATTVKAILALNDMKTTSIKTGQKLKLPVMKVASTDTTPSATAAPTTTPAASEAPASAPAPKTMAN